MFFKKKEIILKANLLKGRVAKPEGTKVRKFVNITVRQSRQSGVARATCPD